MIEPSSVGGDDDGRKLPRNDFWAEVAELSVNSLEEDNDANDTKVVMSE